jgi:hypothetical protein
MAHKSTATTAADGSVFGGGMDRLRAIAVSNYLH